MAGRQKPRDRAAQPSASTPARPRRTLFLRLFVLLVAAGALGWLYLVPGARRLAPSLWSLVSVPWSPAPGPIVLISIDTLRADRLPIYGYQRVRTPAIDALAAASVVFERAYAHSPQTLPSHASIFTGLLPFEHGVRDNLGFSLPPAQVTLAEQVRERGYVTAGAVSTYVLRKQVAIDQGFDFYDDQMPAAAPEMAVGQVQRDGADTLAVVERWLSAQASARFFLFFHIYEPHRPYAPRARYAHYSPYDGEIAYADEIVGRFLESLRRRGLYDESIRVPLMVKLPGGGGRRVSLPVQHIDLVPTVLELIGAPRRAGLRGRSLLPLLRGQQRLVEEQGAYSEALYTRYHFGWSELYALTDARYRYVKAPREELYDLQNDPRERRNIAAERPQVRTAMRGALDRLLAGTRLDAPSQVTDEERERLQALGYVGMQAGVADTGDDVSLPDPKDKLHVLEKYREAVNIAGERRFAEAIALFKEILAENPTMRDVWQQLGNLEMRAGRVEDALRSYKRLVDVTPSGATALISVASALLRLRRLDEARAHAEMAAGFADEDVRTRASAHEVLARIALAKNDAAAARRHASLAHEADPTLPLPMYVQARLLHAEGKYDEALPLFLETLRALQARTLTINELHFYTGDTLARLERTAEAEAQFKEEARLFPQNARAWASLAMLYRAQSRNGEAEQAIQRLLTAVPTPEGYGLAIRLWTIFGEPRRAGALRQQAETRFAGDPTLARALAQSNR